MNINKHLQKLISMIIFILRDVLFKMADILTDFRRANGQNATFPPDIKEFCPMNGPCGLYVLGLSILNFESESVRRSVDSDPVFSYRFGILGDFGKLNGLVKKNHNELLNLELF